MKKALILLLLLVVCVNGYSQVKPYTPNRISFTARGKYLAFGLLEDLYWRAYTYGGTVQFGEHHSLGIDGGVFRTRFDNDSDDLHPGSDEKVVTLYSDIVRRTYIYMDYKFIFPVKYQFMYVQAFTKQHGRLYSWHQERDKEYAAENADFFQEYARGRYTEYGVGLGTLFYSSGGLGNFGVDVNLNVAYRKGSYTEAPISWWNGTGKDELIFPYLRFTLFYHFFRYQR